MSVILERDGEDDTADIVQASACEILAKFHGEEVKEANHFALSSSEQLQFLPIPVKLIKAQKTSIYDYVCSHPFVQIESYLKELTLEPLFRLYSGAKEKGPSVCIHVFYIIDTSILSTTYYNHI